MGLGFSESVTQDHVTRDAEGVVGEAPGDAPGRCGSTIELRFSSSSSAGFLVEDARLDAWLDVPLVAAASTGEISLLRMADSSRVVASSRCVVVGSGRAVVAGFKYTGLVVVVGMVVAGLLVGAALLGRVGRLDVEVGLGRVEVCVVWVVGLLVVWVDEEGRWVEGFLVVVTVEAVGLGLGLVVPVDVEEGLFVEVGFVVGFRVGVGLVALGLVVGRLVGVLVVAGLLVGVVVVGGRVCAAVLPGLAVGLAVDGRVLLVGLALVGLALVGLVLVGLELVGLVPVGLTLVGLVTTSLVSACWRGGLAVGLNGLLLSCTDWKVDSKKDCSVAGAAVPGVAETGAAELGAAGLTCWAGPGLASGSGVDSGGLCRITPT